LEVGKTKDTAEMIKSIREPFNALSHAVAAALMGGCTLALVVAGRENPAAWISFLVFGLGAIFLYVSSALYHWTPQALSSLQKMDHTAIYVMIAGCYTPFSVLALSGSAGWWVLGSQWVLALTGIVLTLTMKKPPTWVRIVLYLVMGWMALPFAGPAVAAVGWAPFWWMVAGGLFYTVGVIFYASNRPRLWPGVFSSHELWHVFVMAGTACHVFLMAGLI
jgi:hemolysin III